MQESLPVTLAEEIYSNEVLEIYHLLFADNLNAFREMEKAYPCLFAKTPDTKELIALAQDKSTEARTRVLAYRKLEELNILPEPKEVLGVIAENHFEDGGMDTVALYADGALRYINQSGAMIFSEVFIDEEMQNRVFDLARKIVPCIGPLDGERLPPPAPGMFRVTFLVNGSIYFGQAPVDMAFEDEIMGPLAMGILNVLKVAMDRCEDTPDKEK